MNELKISGTVKKVESMTGSIAVATSSGGTNDYEKLINKPLVFDSSTNFPPTGNVERLYIATNVNKIYYWTGVTYAEISGSGGGTGTDGKSPYIHANGNWYVYNDLLQIWVDTGVKAEGVDGTNGTNGLDGKDGADGTNGTDGIDGKSAYQTWLDSGYTGTELEFLASLKGIQGDVGYDGEKGEQGETGKSAYEIAIENGFIGTETEWIASLKGAKGDKGADGTNGVDGTKGDKGDKGIDGTNGADGYTPIKGTDYFTTADIESLGIANKADTTYVDGLVGGINTELATKSINPTIITDLSATTQTVTLENNTEYRYGTLTSLTITWTTSDIHSAVAFTGGTGVTFSITAGVKIVGTDVTSNVFKPVKGKRYNLGFEYDGVNRTVYVSGVI